MEGAEVLKAQGRGEWGGGGWKLWSIHLEDILYFEQKINNL